MIRSYWLSAALILSGFLFSAHASAGFISGPTTSSNGTFQLTWSSSCSGGVDTLKLIQNGVVIQNSCSQSRSFNSLPNGTYSYVVQACFYEQELWSWFCYNDTPYHSVAVGALIPGLSTPTTLATANTQGTIPYVADVDDDGLAVIGIPLEVPPGVNGLTPTLALNYDSGYWAQMQEEVMTESTLGYGWRLNGTSEIRRCRQHTSNSPALALNSNDRLCLDGEMLNATSGSYWGSTTEYRTENASFTKVKANGYASNTWFEVRTSDGRILKYGNTTDTQIELGGTDYVWALSEEVDRYGNRIDYDYHEYATDGEFYIDKISYAGAEVSFSYAERSASSKPSTTVGSQTTKRNVYLHKITTKVNGTKVREYRLTHQDTSNQVKMTNIQACGYDITGVSLLCRSPLVLDWSTWSGRPGTYKITDSLGALTHFGLGTYLDTNSSFPNFHNLANSSNYSSSSPFGSNQRLYARSLSKSDGRGGLRTWTVKRRSSPKFATDGRGYVGHQGIVVTDNQRGSNNYNLRWLNYPYIGKVAANYYFIGTHTGTPVLKSEYVWSNQSLYSGAVKYPYVSKSRQLDYDDVNLFGFGEEIQSYTFSNNVPTTLTVTQNGWNSATLGTTNWTGVGLQKTLETKSYYTNNVSSWLIGFVNKTEVRHKNVPGESDSPVVTTTYAQESGKLAIDSMTRNPSTDLDLVTNYTYNSNGNLTNIGISGDDVSPRNISYSSYIDSRYPGSITNGVGHVSTSTYDKRFGAPLKTTDPNGHTIDTVRGGFGEPFSRNNSVTGIDSYTRQACPAYCGGLSAVGNHAVTYRKNVATNSSGATETHYYDILGRVVRIEQSSFGATPTKIDFGYDTLGRLEKRSLPYFSGTPQFTIYAYDHEDRIVHETRPDGGLTVWNRALHGLPNPYLRLVVKHETIVTPGAATEIRDTYSYYNALGQLDANHEAVGTADQVGTHYNYDAYGNLNWTRVNSDASTIVTMDYDQNGNKLSISDPDTGTTTFDYDALNQVILQTDAKGQVTDYIYDNVGRPRHRYDDVGGSDYKANTWTYDVGSYAKGQLTSMTRTGGFSETYGYNNKSLRSTTTTSIPYALGTQALVTTQTFDSFARPIQTTYPSGYKVKRVYNAMGQKSQLRNGTTNTLLHEINSTDAFGRVTSEAYGNGRTTTSVSQADSGRLSSRTTNYSGQALSYTWRSNGTLKSRADDGVTETFGYDTLGRLTSAVSNNVGTDRSLTTDYDLLGNIQYKNSNISGDIDANSYSYGGTSNAGPHAVSSVNIAGVTHTLHYDANGNVVTDDASSGFDRTFAYNTFNKPTRITVGSTSSPEAQDTFAYDPNGNRYLKTSTHKVSGVTKTTYTLYHMGGNYELIKPVSDPSIQKIEKTRIGSVAQNTITTPTTGSPVGAVLYFYRDHLGSVHTIANSSGTVLDRLAFDPFGSRRLSNYSEDISTSELNEVLNNAGDRTLRGFTGHEHLDRTGVIHMNGRIYDPVIGRFLSADPIVQAATMSQSFNRYSYVFNNPLSFTDPNGYESDSCGGCDDTPRFFKILFGTKDARNSSPPNKFEEQKISDFILERAHRLDILDIQEEGRLIIDSINEGAYYFRRYGIYNYEDPFLGSYVLEAAVILIPGSKIRALRYLDEGAAAYSKVATTTAKQLQKKFKHAGDFGVAGNYNRANAQKYNQAIQKHLNSSGTKEIPGIYRGKPVTFHTNPDTGLTVIQNPNGSFLSGWKLNPQQLKHVLKDGKL